jgi:uncharacterized protein DUF2442
MLLKIDGAAHLGDARFELRFNDGRTGVVDVGALVEDGPPGLFDRLRDESFVRQFELRHGALCWPDELDVAPEYLYFLAFRDAPGLQEKFAEWGYLPQTAPA